ADPQHEAAAALLRHRVRRLDHRTGVAVEDVRDAAGEHQRAGVRREVRGVGERVPTEGLGQPERAVAQRLDLLRDLDRDRRAHPVGGAPDAQRTDPLAPASELLLVEWHGAAGYGPTPEFRLGSARARRPVTWSATLWR